MGFWLLLVAKYMRWTTEVTYSIHFLIMPTVIKIFGWHQSWGRQFGYLSWLDTYIWVVCGWCDFKNKYSKDMLFKEIGLQAQIMIIILGLIVNIIGGDLYDQLLSTRIFDLTTNWDIHRSSRNYEESGYDPALDLLPILN